ncbi:MAG: hypothetical protein ACYCOU_07500, partial [Sulfobacillus sp.]
NMFPEISRTRLPHRNAGTDTGKKKQIGSNEPNEPNEPAEPSERQLIPGPVKMAPRYVSKHAAGIARTAVPSV